jgi:uncharacterized protein with ParB-like and HNH nuclease domain
MKEQTAIENIEEEILYDDDTDEVHPPDVFSFNELRSCSDLFRMYSEGILEIKPDFQRDIVWKNPDRTRFIDSLLKKLPIPSLCFSLDSKTSKMQVIDGLQRIDTIRQFLEDESWILSPLNDVHNKISGKSVAEIKMKHPDVYQTVQNVSLPITLLRCDHSKPGHSEYIFTIFRRLNDGGIKLSNQEIRNAIFSGNFNDLLRKCNSSETWKKILRNATGKKTEDDRFRSIEVILRIFAFHDYLNKYDGKLSHFLNLYMQKYRVLNEQDLLKKQ